MVGYKFYWRDPIKGYQLIGVLPERRGNPKRITTESVLNWGKKYFGYNLDPEEMFFIEVEINGEIIRLIFEEGKSTVFRTLPFLFISFNNHQLPHLLAIPDS